MPKLLDTNIPVLRHLTAREAHLFVVGVWYGIDAAVKLATGRPRAARRVFNDTRSYAESDNQSQNRPDLLNGFIRDAWYLLGGFTIGFLATAGVVSLGVRELAVSGIIGGVA